MTTIGLQVPAYPVGVAGSLVANEAVAYAYSTHRVNGVAMSGPDKYFCKGRDDKYQRVYSRASNSGWANSTTAGSNASVYNGTVEIAVCPVRTDSTRYIVVGGRWYFKGQNKALTPAGNLLFNLYCSTPGGDAGNFETAEVARAMVDKADYWTQVSGASHFWVDFSFNKPFVFGGAPGDGTLGETNLLVSMALDTVVLVNPTTDDFMSGPVNDTGTYYMKTSGEQWTPLTGYAPAMELYCVQFTDDRIETDNYLYAYVFKTTQNAAGTGQTSPDISDLDFMVTAPGVTDDSAGDITGTAGLLLERPDHVVSFLTRRRGDTWSGWTSSDRYDFTDYSAIYSAVFGTATHPYYRKVSGVLEGDLTCDQAIAQICEECCCSIVPSSTAGKLTLLPWGTTLTSAKVFTDENSSIKSWNRLGSASVVNTMLVAYGKGCLNYTEAAEVNNQGFTNFNGAISSEDIVGIILNADSFDLYGEREAAARQLNWLGDATSATTYVKHMLSVFDHPHWIFTMEVPFKDNVALRVGQVVEVLSSRLPAYLGTTDAARSPYYSGTEVDILRGHYMNRAVRYRCQIVGAETNWDSEIAPTIIFTCRILRPYHPNDPT